MHISAEWQERYALRTRQYKAAKADPVASVILDAIKEYDTIVFSPVGTADTGRIALEAAERIKEQHDRRMIRDVLFRAARRK